MIGEERILLFSIDARLLSLILISKRSPFLTGDPIETANWGVLPEIKARLEGLIVV